MELPAIKVLDPTLINQIAAGEVIERPAAVIKELVENALDAQATSIEVILREGGRTFIQVTDNGQGIRAEELDLAVERHATSKLSHGNLFNIQSFGFRGEALPSIGAVSRLTLISRPHHQETAWQIFVEGGVKNEPTKASHPIGTRIIIRDLFYATPVRLKFLKTIGTELSHCIDCINRLAMAYFHVHFLLKEGDRTLLDYGSSPTLEHRLSQILGHHFKNNSRYVEGERENLTLKGWTSLPTYNRSQSNEQFLFVNHRPVRDKIFHTAIKLAYQDLLAVNRHPSVVAFLTLNPEEVDVNVHPAKIEVRFQNPQMVRGLMIHALKQTLHTHSQSTSSHLGEHAIALFRSKSEISPTSEPLEKYSSTIPYPNKDLISQRAFGSFKRPATTSPFSSLPANEQDQPSELSETAFSALPLGKAIGQIYDTFILAEKPESLMIVDQHAAHERLVYQQLKQQYKDQSIKSQAILLPEVLTLSEQDLDTLKPYLVFLQNLGFDIETYRGNTVIVRQIPALLANLHPHDFIKDLLADLKEIDGSTAAIDQLYEVLSGMACRTSIRAGRKLSLQEMNGLLRQMENTLHSGQCNHGRPTYIDIKKTDIEKLFGRR